MIVYFVAAGWRGKADWFKNIQVNPSVQVTVGSHTFKATAAVMQLVEAAATFYIYARRYPLAFRELSRRMMGEVLQFNQEDCFHLAQSVPLVKLMPLSDYLGTIIPSPTDHFTNGSQIRAESLPVHDFKTVRLTS